MAGVWHVSRTCMAGVWLASGRRTVKMSTGFGGKWVQTMQTTEAMALLTLGAGLLPALSSRGWWIVGLTAIAVAIMAVSFTMCLEESEGLAGLLCVIALIAGGVLGLASLVLGAVRWRYRVHGAETALGKPWVAGLILYGLAVLGFFGFISVISG